MTGFSDICRAFGLPAPHGVTPLRGGTAAKVWRLDTDEGAFLLRTLPHRSRGEREWEITEYLRGRGFSRAPAILTAVDGVPAAEREGVWYQLQRYLPGERPDPARDGTAAAVARLVRELDDALARCPVREEDRAPKLRELWQAGKPFWARLRTGIAGSRAEEEIFRCEEREVQLIHGDLGLWNMVGTPEGELWVMDFGSARIGDSGFDCAAALGGIINHTPAELRKDVCGQFVRELAADRGWLLEQLRCWCWRELAGWACLAARGADAAPMAGKFLSALHWAEENLYEC